MEKRTKTIIIVAGIVLLWLGGSFRQSQRQGAGKYAHSGRGIHRTQRLRPGP